MSVTTHHAVLQRQTNAFASAGGRPGLITGISALFRTWRGRIEERRAFAHLDYRDLRDMGLTRWEVENQLAKPFWRA